MMVRLGLALAGLLTLVSPTAAQAGSSPCAVLTGATTLSVQPHDPGLTYVLDRTEAEIERLNTRPLPPLFHLRGLTVYHMEDRLDLKYRMAQVGDGWCLMPTSVSVQVGFTDMTVYIDRKYPKDSCQRKAVAFHENKHVAISYEELNAGLPRIQTDLQAALAAVALPIHVAEVKVGEKYLTDYFSYYLKRDFQEINNRMVTRNTNLDNPQEYASISAMCPAW